MKRNKGFLAGLLIVLLIFAFAACGGETIEPKPSVIEATVAVPRITGEPQSLAFTIGGEPITLEVTATVSDDGTLSYQWFSSDSVSYASDSGIAIDGAIGSTYTPAFNEEGVYFLYVVVTNTIGISKASQKSRLASIAVSDPNNAQFPLVVLASEAFLEFTAAAQTEQPVTVTATVTDSGTLTYQWYSSATAANTEGTQVVGATGASLTVNKTTTSSFYYVEVTNTNSAVSGRSTSKSVSSAVRVIPVNGILTVDPNDKRQYVRGYGGMDACWTSPVMYIRDMETMFNPDILGYNMFRIMIYPHNTDPNLTMDQLIAGELYPDHDKTKSLEFVKIVNKYNGFVLASPWSPPADWKRNQSILAGPDGVLLPEYYQDYADYLREYSQMMYNRGAPIFAISIQNEPNYSDDYDGCRWTGAQMRDFFVQVGRFTEGVKGFGGGKEIPTVWTMNGETANNVNINDDALRDPIARANIDVIGRHIYGSVQVRYALALDGDPPREVWMTEHNINSGNAATYPNDSTWNYVWKFMNDVDVSIRLNDESAFIWWYSKRFYSMIGDGQYATADGVILHRGYGLSHYSKFSIDTHRIPVTAVGYAGDGSTVLSSSVINTGTFSVDSLVSKATAFVSQDGNTISLVMFTPTDTTGGSGTNLGTLKIQLPSGFTVADATALRSTSVRAGQRENVVLSADGNAAYVTLPASNIYSIKLTRN